MENKMTKFRWTICVMLFVATTVNYLDRQVQSGTITSAERKALGR